MTAAAAKTLRLPAWIKAGASFVQHAGIHKDRVYHVRAIVDGMAVCRRWRSEKQDWNYEVLDPEFFEAFHPYIEQRRS